MSEEQGLGSMQSFVTLCKLLAKDSLLAKDAGGIVGAQTLGKLMESGFCCNECAIPKNSHSESIFSSSSTQANRLSSIPIYSMTHLLTPGVSFIIGNIALKPRIEPWRTKHCSISFHETMFRILKPRWRTLVNFGSKPRTMVY